MENDVPGGNSKLPNRTFKGLDTPRGERRGLKVQDLGLDRMESEPAESHHSHHSRTLRLLEDGHLHKPCEGSVGFAFRLCISVPRGKPAMPSRPRAKRTGHSGLLVGPGAVDDEGAIRGAGGTAKELYNLTFFGVINILKPVAEERALERPAAGIEQNSSPQRERGEFRTYTIISSKPPTEVELGPTI